MMFSHFSDALMARVLDVVLPPLITAIAGLLVAVLARQFQKLGLVVTAQQQDQMRVTVRDALLAVEEQARKTPMTSDTKRQVVIAMVRNKLPDVTNSDLHLQIHAQLPVVRDELGQPADKVPKPSTPATFGK